MSYAVEINLDHAHMADPAARELWEQIDQAMRQVGFAPEGRHFVIDVPKESAQARAQNALADLETQRQREGRQLYRYIKEFYGFPREAATDLMAPPVEGIEVIELLGHE